MTKVNTYIKAYSGFTEGDLLRSRLDKRVFILKTSITLEEKKKKLLTELYNNGWDSLDNKLESHLLPIGSPVILLSLDLIESYVGGSSNGLAGFVVTFLDVKLTRKGICFLKPYQTLIESFRKLV